jgi:hypothetical protein
MISDSQRTLQEKLNVLEERLNTVLRSSTPSPTQAEGPSKPRDGMSPAAAVLEVIHENTVHACLVVQDILDRLEI